jgi:predicted  nucleic acid-binding Zn-ribbon protein
MDVLEQQKRKYTTPRWVQAWFLGRSRALWKRKYQEAKRTNKRLQNQVNDVTKSRAKWRETARQESSRVRELEAANAALQQQLAAEKKGAPAGAGNRGQR